MKVINILGSPRKKGTSARIAQSFVETAKDRGATVDTYYLNGMDFKGCQACEKCHTKRDHCILKDELTPLLEAMATSDIALFSTPVYYGDTSGQFKTFFDRTWSHVKPNFMEDLENASRLPKGKSAVFILSQGDVAQNHTDIIDRYSNFLKLYGYDLKIIRATDLVTGEPDADVSQAQAQAVKIAEELINP